MKILLTAFDAFGGEKINPTQEILKEVRDEILGAEIIKLEIPTVQNKSFMKIKEIAKIEKPNVILSLGQAGGRADINIERVAINIDDYGIPDNEGNQPVDEVIQARAPSAYFVSIPIKAIVNELQNIGIPAIVSNTAGTFVCNHVTFRTAHFVTRNAGKKGFPKKMQSGFIHVPYLPKQVKGKANKPSMSLSMMVRAVEVALETIIRNF